MRALKYACCVLWLSLIATSARAEDVLCIWYDFADGITVPYGYQARAAKINSIWITKETDNHGERTHCFYSTIGIKNLMAAQQDTIKTLAALIDSQIKAGTERIPELLAKHVANQKLIDELKAMEDRLATQEAVIKTLQQRLSELEKPKQR